MKQGFSLVELSIVLVILGLLTGGILAGQSLIRASEMRAVTNEYMRYNTAVQTFRDKYFAIPGDMTNATAFWGTSTACGGTGTPGTCNGDGNGVDSAPTAAGATGEMYQFWRQLALAGLIEGSYTGIAGSGGVIDSTLGVNLPKSRMANAGWAVYYNGNYAGNSSTYAYDYGNNSFMFGAPISTSIPQGAALKPEEAWNIDTKLDDGKPASGKFIAREVNGFGAASTCTTSTSQTDYTGSYNLSNAAVACAFWLAKQF